MFEEGLHEFLLDMLRDINSLGVQISTTTAFWGDAMALSIQHTTTYRFDEPAQYGLQQLRLTPKSRAGQEVLSWQMLVEGGRVECDFTDEHLNQVSAGQFRARRRPRS